MSMGIRERFYSNIPMMDQIADTLYDRIDYPVSGGTLKFFQNPVGVGFKTFRDTNMVNAGCLPADVRFLACGIELVFLPSPQLNGRKQERIADINAVARSGFVQLRVLDRMYMQAAPLAAVPARQYWHEDYDSKKESDKDADETFRSMMRVQLSEQFRKTDYGAFGGKPFDMVPLFIESFQPFHVIVTELAALPSGQPGELWCRLPGKRARPI